MNYTMTPGELKIEPELLVHSVQLTQENNPYFVQPDNKWDKPFKYKFSCICNGELIEVEFEQPDKIEYGQYDWSAAARKWLLPYLESKE